MRGQTTIGLQPIWPPPPPPPPPQFPAQLCMDDLNTVPSFESQGTRVIDVLGL